MLPPLVVKLGTVIKEVSGSVSESVEGALVAEDVPDNFLVLPRTRDPRNHHHVVQSLMNRMDPVLVWRKQNITMVRP